MLYLCLPSDLLACDPWSYHVTVDDHSAPPLGWRDDGLPPRLVQTFLYMRDDADDNHYAHPVRGLLQRNSLSLSV